MNTIPISPGDNTVEIVKADIDGVHLVETENTKNKVYIYYSEFDILIQNLRKAKYEWKEKQIRGQQRLRSKENPNNAESIYKDCGVSTKRDKYVNYMGKSADWAVKRRKRLAFDGHRCVNCGSRVGLQVHHKSYVNFGNESVKDDLVTLCSRCHGGLHG